MWSGQFWKAATERMVRVFALSLGSVLFVDEGLELSSINWKGILVTAAIAAGGSLVLSLTASKVAGPDGGPSFGQERLAPEPVRTVHPDDPDRRI